MLSPCRCPACHRGWLSSEHEDVCIYCGRWLYKSGRVPAAPFVEWLKARRLSLTRVAAVLGRDESWLRKARSFDERDVEIVGIVLEDNPRLTEELYPQLAEVV